MCAHFKQLKSATTIESRLDRWSLGQAVSLLAGAGAAAIIKRPWPVAAVALASFIVLIASCAGAWTPSRRFGWANGVTSIRLALVLALACGLLAVPARLVALAVLGIFTLDGLDGWLARRTGCASCFGALFDMETDALLVLVVSIGLWQRGQLGVWILTPGLLRYVYVLWLALLPERAPPMPRSQLGRLAFCLLMIGLMLALVLSNPWSTVVALGATLVVAISFARSFYWSWTHAVEPRRGN